METQHRPRFPEPLPRYASHRRTFSNMDSHSLRKRAPELYPQEERERNKVHRAGTSDSHRRLANPVFDPRPELPPPAADSFRVCGFQTTDPDTSRESLQTHGDSFHVHDTPGKQSIEAGNDTDTECDAMLEEATAMNVDAENGSNTAFTPCPSGSVLSEMPLTDANKTCVDITNSSELRSVSGRSPCPLVDVTNKFELKSVPALKRQMEEGDIHRLCQRQKQIEYGKNTSGYERYIELVPKSKRKNKDPQTPNPKQICSKRSWDGQIRKWRRLLHNYDPPIEAGVEEAEDFSSIVKRKSPGGYNTANDSTIGDDSSCRSQGDEQRNRGGNKNLELSIYDDWVET